MRRALLVVAALGVAGTLGGCYIVVTPDGVGAGVDVTPRYAYIPGTQIGVVSSVGGDVFFYSGRYYRYYDGCWWHSHAWNSGWARTIVVPDVFLKIPSWHSKYHIVRVHPRYRVLRARPHVAPAQPPKKIIRATPAVPVPPKGPRVIRPTPAAPTLPKGPRVIRVPRAAPRPPSGSRVIKVPPGAPKPPSGSRVIKVPRGAPRPPRGPRVIKVPPAGPKKPKKETKAPKT
jgi:hypothetical protein